MHDVWLMVYFVGLGCLIYGGARAVTGVVYWWLDRRGA